VPTHSFFTLITFTFFPDLPLNLSILLTLYDQKTAVTRNPAGALSSLYLRCIQSASNLNLMRYGAKNTTAKRLMLSS
jgi:hypothetical protein